MDTITIYDGLILTIVAMVVVFIVLASIWGLVELVAKFMMIGEPSSQAIPAENPSPQPEISDNPKHKKTAEIIALVLASEDEPDKKFEIFKSKRIR